MESGMQYPFAELYAQGNQTRPRIIQGVPIARWKKNERAHHCGICIKKFGFLRRRHHCRACGDVFCRRCLGFCLVDVPIVGVDISYTCIKCIRQHSNKPSLVEDLANLAQAFDNQYDSRVVRTRSNTAGSNNTSISTNSTVGSSQPNSPASLGSALTPICSPRSWEVEYKVIVSQYHNQKLYSVCSLLGDYLECSGGAIVLMEEPHVWVLAHKGLRTSSLHSPTLLSLCQQAMSSKESFTAKRGSSRKTPIQHKTTVTGTSSSRSIGREVFQFFGAAPIFHKDKHFTPIGCIVAMDTRIRDDVTAKRVQKTLENLARLVMNLLAEEENILRIFSSGDFKIFASNALDLPPSDLSAYDRFGVVSPSNASSPGASPSSTTELPRSRSFVFGDEATSFFARYAKSDDRGLATKDQPRKHAQSQPEHMKSIRRPPPTPTQHVQKSSRAAA